ncbi:hypothetical protein ABZW30_13430 [Kitasatospora sp. NPDC004669]|uniref:hypothetical protein n=1 Tax=Kitasatospora sp. NPDC004669 TaxID=3154555 RepID=UPI0033B985FE
MRPEHCPFHRCEDTCLPVARLLAQAGFLEPSPNAPAALGTVVAGPQVPPRHVTHTLIAQYINTWGRVVLDPTLPPTQADAPDERSLRYSLQALWETVSESVRRRIASLDSTAPAWWNVSSALQEAQSAARRTTVGDSAEGALWWYIALLHLDHARTLWKDSIGHSLPQ